MPSRSGGGLLWQCPRGAYLRLADTDCDGVGDACEVVLPPACATAPLGGCIAAGKAVVGINEKTAGKEKLTVRLKNLTAATTQADFGDPVAGMTRYTVCVYDQFAALVGTMDVDRGGRARGPQGRDGPDRHRRTESELLDGNDRSTTET